MRSCQKIMYSVLVKLFLPSAVSCGDGRSSCLPAVYCRVQPMSSHSVCESLGKASGARIRDYICVGYWGSHSPVHRREQ